VSALPSTTPAKAQHLAYLDGLRGLAALQVVLGHAAMQIHWGSTTQSGLVQVMNWPVSFAREAVAMFIVLSGFCLMLPVLRRDGVLQGGALLFLKRRARRILPPYFFALGLSLVMIWTIIGQKTQTHWDVTLPADGKAILSHILLVQDLFHDTSARINHVMWSISVEWRIYFLFPLLVLLWRKLGAVTTSLVAITSSYLLVRWFHFSWLNTGAFGMCPQFIGLFALGMFGAGVAYSDVPTLRRLRGAIPWGLVMCALIVAVIVTKELKLPWYLRDYVVGVFSVCLIIFASARPSSQAHRTLAWKPVAFLGTFAYSLYLMHAPFLQILTQYVISPLGLSSIMSFLMLVAAGTPVVIALCYGFFLICERPFLNRPVPLRYQTSRGSTASKALVALGISGRQDS
jgi:peptidoglycan/LPS O-acetylase OafA/YrhL